MLNGRLPGSTLAPIAGGHLERNAARSWNAMNVESRRRYGVTLRPSGPRSSYRTYREQVFFWNLYRSGRGNLAAYPGSSNHGLGLAVDVATPRMRQIVDRIGSKYGWAKRWSDAPSEWWHLRYRPGVWTGRSTPPTLKRGSSNASVKKAQQLLRAKNVRGAPRPSGYFNLATKTAVKRFQRKHHLKADGVVGSSTWKKLRS
jgi:peptidoglycan hydrolase-like protein with peptidoglycan-binding domain